MTILSNTDLKAVVFDVYGTLAEIKDRRNSPFKKLLRYGQEFGRTPRRDDAANVMSHPGGVREAASRLGIAVPEELFQELEADLLMELNSVSLFEDVNFTLMNLKNRGVKIGLCSNLAEPYAGPILSQLSVQLDCYAWSFLVGTIKPSPAIYEYVLRELDCLPGQVLFIGDTQVTDVDGPIHMGMQAKLIDRAKSRCLKDVLGIS